MAAFILTTSMLFLSGCETTKGVAVGVGATAIGVGKDAKSAWQGVVKADEWVKKNLW